MTNQQLWQAIMGNMEVEISRHNFQTWYQHTMILEKADDYIVVGVPNLFTKQWLQAKYQPEMMKALKMLAPEVKEIRYQLLSGNTPSTAQVSSQKPEGSSQQQGGSQSTTSNGQRTVSIANTVHGNLGQRSAYPQQPMLSNSGLNPKYTFEHFVTGKNNELAHAGCIAVAKNPGHTYNPLFIYGGVGLGKTHLMQAVGNEILAKNPRTRVIYVPSEKFTNELVEAIKTNRTGQFKEFYRSADVLMIDDVQFIAGKEQTQEEFFHTFNALHQDNKQVILSSDRLPKDIPAIEERLVSRFEWGMIADIQAPNLETRLAILQSKCGEKHYEVEQDVLLLIAEMVQINIRELEGALNRLVVYCQLNNLKPTIDVAKNVLANLASAKKKVVSVKKLMEVVADFYNITVDDILRQSRRKEYVKPRQIAMYLMRSQLENSFPSIGEHFNGRDHTTVMHAVDKITKLMHEKESMKQELDLIVNKLYM